MVISVIINIYCFLQQHHIYHIHHHKLLMSKVQFQSVFFLSLCFPRNILTGQSNLQFGYYFKSRFLKCKLLTQRCITKKYCRDKIRNLFSNFQFMIQFNISHCTGIPKSVLHCKVVYENIHSWTELYKKKKRNYLVIRTRTSLQNAWTVLGKMWTFKNLSNLILLPIFPTVKWI